MPWTIESYAAHNEALRVAQEKFEAERDRRYAEVKAAEERAVTLVREAEQRALMLAREIQTYKDEKANELREQINRERGLYASKEDVGVVNEKFQPIASFIASAQGRTTGSADNRAMIAWFVALVLGLIAIGSFVFRPQTTTPPTIYYVPAQPGTLIPSTQERPQ